MKLTDQTIRGLPLADKGQRYYHDAAIAGLAVCVGARTKTFTLVIRNGAKRKRVTLGQYDPPRFTLSMAREKARDFLAADRLRKTGIPLTTFEEALETYYRVHLSKLRKETQRVITQTLAVIYLPTQMVLMQTAPRQAGARWVRHEHP
jgi:hypothetical protein